MRYARRRITATLSLVLSVALLASCVPRQIRAAQDTFNQGAQSENALRAATINGGSPSLGAASAASSYRMTLDLLNTELSAHKQDLAQEQLLGTAMMLKALSLWRLADLDDGHATTATDEELSRTLTALDALARDQPATLGTRDRVMMKALPGLRDHDRGLRATTLTEATANFQSACTVLGKALEVENPPPNHPVRVYVRLAQLSTLRAYQSAVYRFDPQDSPQRRATVKQIHDCAEVVVLALKPVLRNDAELTKFVEFMNTAIGVSSVSGISGNPVPSCPCTS